MRFSILVVAVAVCVACDTTSPVGASIHFTAISVGDDQVCALDDQHRAWCWGSNVYGQLGVSDSACVVACGALPVTTDLRFTAITAGWSFTCALTADGTAYCWGSDDSDELGQTTPPPNTCEFTASCSSTPLPVSGGWKFSQIAAGLQNGCGVTTTGVGKCWGGTGALNPLGLAQKPFTYPTPFTVVLSQSNDSTWESMNRPTSYTDCGTTSTHVLACWGFNSAGQAGIGTIGKLTNVTPTLVAAPTPLHGVAVGANFACALDASGNAYCWGSIPNGALGLGPSPAGGVACTVSTGIDTCYPAPTKVIGGLTFTALTAGSLHVCGLTASGDAYCWGQSYSGAAGVGVLPGAIYVTAPTLVSGGLRFASIAAGNANTCGITTNSEAWCWGEELFGELGNIGQTGQFSSVPVRIIPRVIPP